MRNIFRLFPKRLLVAYFVGLTILLLACSLVLIVGLAQVTSADYLIDHQPPPLLSTGQTIAGTNLITDRTASTIFTSHIPITIADAINSLLYSNKSALNIAYPMTVTLVEMNNTSPIVVRGLPPATIDSEPSLTPFANYANSTSMILLGSEAAAELNAHVGSLVILSSPQTNGKIFNLTVKGIFSSHSESDYEGVVALSLGQQLGDNPPGFASAIVLPSSNVPFKISANYATILNYTGFPGTLSVIDSSGFVHYSTAIAGNSTSIVHKELFLSLPFGLYSVDLEQSGLRTSLKEFTTAANGTEINIQPTLLVSAKNFVSVSDQNNSQPELENPVTSKIYSPSYYNSSSGSWVFAVPSGDYILSSQNTSTPLLVFGNATYSFGTSSVPLDSQLNVKITSSQNLASSYSLSSVSSGTYTVTVQDASTNSIIFATTTSNSSLSIPVESGHSYHVTVLTSSSQVSLEQNAVIPSSSGSSATVTFSIPNVPLVPQASPLSSYSKLGIGAPTESALFSYLEIGAVVSTLALFAIVLGLLMITIFAIGIQLVSSMNKELKAIAFIFPERKALFNTLELPLLVVSLGASVLAILISIFLFGLLDMNLKITFSGYGLESYPIFYAVVVIFGLGLLSWCRSYFSMDKFVRLKQSRSFS